MINPALFLKEWQHTCVRPWMQLLLHLFLFCGRSSDRETNQQPLMQEDWTTAICFVGFFFFPTVCARWHESFWSPSSVSLAMKDLNLWNKEFTALLSSSIYHYEIVRLPVFRNKAELTNFLFFSIGRQRGVLDPQKM